MLSPRTWVTRHAQVALESLGRLYRNPLATLMTAAVIGIALAMPASLYLLLNNLDRLSGSWDGQASLSVFLKDTVPGAVAGKLVDRVRGWPEVAEVTLVTPEQALEEFRQRSGFADVLDTLDENPLPTVLLVSPAQDHADPQSAAAMQNRLQALPETELAQLDLQWVQRLSAMLALAQRGVLLIGALLALAVLLVVGNTIRLEIQNRREEIVVTKLIGATDGFIRRPFLYSGTWYGIIGALLAWLLVETGFWLLSEPVRQLVELYQGSFQLQTLPFVLLLVLLAGGILLGLLGSWLAVWRHLGAIEPS
ncbi:MAG: cell division protein FtsX [Gammaproteobacteria bacterium]|nr:MAG: cell division protein FtsX [Gammaproteobacteria bacterium]